MERSSISSELSGEDTDMTVKATVTDPAHGGGIKLTILKRPKLVSTTPLAPGGTIAGVKSPTRDVKKGPAAAKPPRSLVEIFAWVPMRSRDAKFVFKFQGRVQLCMFSERQKAQSLARAIAAQHAAISPYRCLCAGLALHGKPRGRGAAGVGRPRGARGGALNLAIML